ncbi:pyridoxamine 5'-phosphate oxidase family protein [Gordonia sp. CPCC 206044]|uniref:pyridoxamine 5'-phosphate oxidase family protein n=1 Tax=Gordonia sp. CPCC 206044 TaxID=3140793 RepID=UPI003AF381C3
MTSNAFYHEGSLELQRQQHTTQLAAHIRTRYVTDYLTDTAATMIETADCVFLATADAAGRPDCSYKGGLPGFIRVIDPQTIAIPNYDGNGMFRSLGNITVNPAVGMLFIDFVNPARLRINGHASVHTSGEIVGEFTDADAVTIVTVEQAFENCPRYIHNHATGEYSPHCPRPNYQPPDPEWKLKPEYDGIVRRTSSSAVALDTGDSKSR